MPSTNSRKCHNCRRRRLRCDGSWPICNKCAATGQECLGYGKVFVWTEGIDAQGNLKPSPAGRKPTAATTLSRSATPAAVLTPSGTPTGSTPSGSPSHRDQTDYFGHLGQPHQAIMPASTEDSRGSNFGALTDPVFQDLDRTSRYYLAHFADRVCKDMVNRDAPESNPFRELIPLTKKHPLLLQILVATSAIHWANIFRPITAIPTGLADPGGYLAQLRSKDLVSRQALIHALTAKQKAMGHLREVLDTLDPAASEVTLAAMHFFVKFDLIDLDKNNGSGWQAHLEGASSILALLASDKRESSSSRMLRDWAITDCFIYHILGSTLTSGGLAARIARYAFELLPVMKRVEATGYLSCPPEILQIILLASQLSYEMPCTDSYLSAADDALALIDKALAFDISVWSAQLLQQSISGVPDMESRVHVASAHRSAACLYILQALPPIRSVRAVDTDFLVDDILSHLTQVEESDPYFKASSWPTFIAGAETRSAEKRTWALKRLLAIWEICPWGYIFTAIEMLKATWQLQDNGGAASTRSPTNSHGTGNVTLGSASNGGGGGVEVGGVSPPAMSGVNWLQDLKGLGFDYLIV